MTFDVLAAAERGAALLDAREPGWADRLDLGRLAMEDCDRCVIGQIYGGDFVLGLLDLGLTVERPRDVVALGGTAAEHGFTIPEDNVCGSEEGEERLWAALRAAWVLEASARG